MKLSELMKQEDFEMRSVNLYVKKQKRLDGTEYNLYVHLHSNLLICSINGNWNDVAVCKDKDYLLRCIDCVRNRYNANCIPIVKYEDGKTSINYSYLTK